MLRVLSHLLIVAMGVEEHGVVGKLRVLVVLALHRPVHDGLVRFSGPNVSLQEAHAIEEGPR